MRLHPLVCVFSMMVVAVARLAAAGDPISFNADIRPILSEHCFACHGPDGKNRAADLRLDTLDGATADLGGHAAIVPKASGQSEVIARLRSTDPDLKMPPPETGKKPTAEEIALLERWINEGAEYEGHWAYEPLERPDVPAAAAGTARNPVDAFIDRDLTRRGLKPVAEADRPTLVRRLFLDLTGLPPTPADVDAFVADARPDAYASLVDRLLASPHHAERMAQWWLDLARYADTVGYHGDQPMSVWPYRDWVIAAFRDNMPFDQFTRQQLAGDLRPNATRDDKIAAVYNRLSLMSAEGGGQAKEYLAKYAADRVRGVSGAWLGSTVGCAECHDHKYDPFTARDFYTLAAYFADIQEQGIYNAFAPQDQIWGKMERFYTPEEAAQMADFDRQLAEAKQALEAETPEIAMARETWITVAAAADPAAPPPSPPLPEPVKKAIAKPAAERSAGEQKVIVEHYRSIAPELKEAREAVAAIEKERKPLLDRVPPVPVTVAGKRREVRILPRGNWMDDSGEVVAAAPPAFLPQPAAAADREPSRLDLADWLVARDNPLVARVLANRLWAICFGQGLSRRLDDHGSQGEPPSHPDLIDWLAVELRDGGGARPWDIRHVLKLIVTSDAYRRSSTAPHDLVARDPDNRLLARQNRYRVDAENVRDTLLAVSGLLVPTIGGPSVKPYQPEGYWDYLNFPKRTYVADTGEKLHRRGLYTWWQRQYLHPAMVVFDAPSREECTARRPRSNTPLQALVLLNDPASVEAARALAAKTLAEAGSDPRDRGRFMLRRAVGRVPTDAEVDVVVRLAEAQRGTFAGDAKAAKQFLAVGAFPAPANVDPVDLAAWTSAARAVLALHETILRN